MRESIMSNFRELGLLDIRNFANPHSSALFYLYNQDLSPKSSLIKIPVPKHFPIIIYRDSVSKPLNTKK
jgi:hypothetical protein